MNLREWTTRAIQEGGTAEYVGGMGVKLGVEFALSTAVGLAATPLILRFVPVDALIPLLGVQTEPAIQVGLIGVILSQFVFCSYAPRGP